MSTGSPPAERRGTPRAVPPDRPGRSAAPDRAGRRAADAECIDPAHADLLGLLDRQATLREAARRARAVTGADIALAGEIEPLGPATGQDDDGRATVVRAWAGTRHKGLHNLVVPSGLGLGGKVLATEQAFRVRDYATSRRITHHFDAPIGAEGIRAMAGVPVRAPDGRVIGTLFAARREPGQIGDTALDALARVAAAAAVAVSVADRAQARRQAEADAERRRIAVALHDSVGARLFSIGAQVRDLRAEGGVGASVDDRLAALEHQLAEASAELRRSLAALGEPPAGRALAAALAGDCRAFEDRTGIATTPVALTGLPEPGPARSGAVLGAVREALLNVEKHAQASCVAVTASAVDGVLTVVVADDGVGLTSAERRPGPRDQDDRRVLPSGGMGLSAAEERLQRLGGELRVVGNEDGGLTVRIRVPCA